MLFYKKNFSNFTFLMIFIIFLFLNFSFFKKLRLEDLKGIKCYNYKDSFEKRTPLFFDIVDKLGFKRKTGFIIKESCHNIANWFSGSLENKILLTKDDWVSPPGSLKIEINRLPFKMYYAKEKINNMENINTWSYRSSLLWFGVKEGAKYKLSLYYKGAGPAVYLNLLKLNSTAKILAFRNFNESVEEWQRIEMTDTIPLDGLALQLEISVNDIQKAKTLLIDDVVLEIIKGN